ncbi:ketopantoate reductase family protein [Alkalihalobacillus sp. AL-G]|uniref:ketopantoate reductase family protein n=1 Tax=Alkalihalobacillus sp. AL-G TaxID=2926399 RepID=UPI00272A5A5D|nr:2-dehydropantoate 2-reductase [Alkalihalobacillus sp. AL-G]WLD93826.1 2-dehydropantoate 2-reductase [Alkalihalobacillus sp. AL-G]
MKTLIVGAGAMGCLFGGKLKQSNFDVTLFNRKNDHMKTIEAEGLRIIERDGTTSNVDIPVVTDPKNLAERYDLIIILVKTFATEKVLNQILHTMDEESIILTLQNGVGNIERLEQMVPNSLVGAGGAGCGAGIIEPGLIAHRAWGKTFIGFSSKKTESNGLQKIADMLTKSGLKTYVSDDVQSVIWSKLLVNVAYNGLTAVTRLKNADVVLPVEGKEVVRKLVEEAVSVADAKGINLLFQQPVRECIEMGIEEIGKNKSSMLTDVINERKTEIDVINGAVTKYGASHSIPTPYNEMMTSLVKIIESSYSKIVTST